MLDFLLKKLRPLELDDPFFGRIVYMKMPGDRRSYWEAQRVFGPTGREIEIFVDAPASQQPPSPRQREFFSAVEREYPRILEAVDGTLRSEFEGWTGQPLDGPLDAEFNLSSFSIPDAPMEKAEWEVSFDSASNEGALFSVCLTGMTPTASTVDD